MFVFISYVAFNRNCTELQFRQNLGWRRWHLLPLLDQPLPPIFFPHLQQSLDEIRHRRIAPTPALPAQQRRTLLLRRTLLPTQVPPAPRLHHQHVRILQTVIQLPRELSEHEKVVPRRDLQQRDAHVRDVSMAGGIPPVRVPVLVSDARRVRRMRVVSYQVGRGGVVQPADGGAEEGLLHGVLESGIVVSFEGLEVDEEALLDAGCEDDVPGEAHRAGVDVEGVSHGGSASDVFWKGAVEGFFPEVLRDDVAAEGVSQ
mmetsp:Transcript_6758/g.14785  ORF Transcript_6758/g.14785 Transcript_6758/m.14785 type:complete len:258 (-) Transcript_6758:507-1280(-)